MARYSDSDDDRKKQKKKKKKHTSRSKSTDSSSSYDSHKKSKSRKKRKRKSRSPVSVSHSNSRQSRSRDRSSRRSRSGSHSRDRSRDKDYSRYRDKKSRDRDWSKERDRSQRSRSRDKKSDWRSRRSRSRSRGSWRSRSRSRPRRSRSRDRSRSSKRYEKGSYHSKKSASPEIKETKKDDPCAKIPGFAEMEPSEQAKIRLKMALQAAAAADEQLRKMQEQSSLALDQRSIKEQPNFAEKVENIENAGFTQSTFQSGSLPARVKQQKESSEEKGHDDAIFGVVSNNKLEDKIIVDSLTEKIPSNIDIDTYAHPSLFVDVNEKKKRWIQKLCAFRKRRLTGVILS